MHNTGPFYPLESVGYSKFGPNGPNPVQTIFILFYFIFYSPEDGICSITLGLIQFEREINQSPAMGKSKDDNHKLKRSSSSPRGAFFFLNQ